MHGELYLCMTMLWESCEIIVRTYSDSACTERGHPSKSVLCISFPTRVTATQQHRSVYSDVLSHLKSVESLAKKFQLFRHLVFPHDVCLIDSVVCTGTTILQDILQDVVFQFLCMQVIQSFHRKCFFRSVIREQ
jgi:predicted amidophosphoribosyltransferase